MAGPRQTIFFDSARVKAAIVTCGGLCPGINNVIRTLVFELHYRYGVRSILGIRYGYRGLHPEVRLRAVPLTPDVVKDIHEKGGSILSSSRGRAGRGGDRGLPPAQGDLAALHHRRGRDAARRARRSTRR